MAMGSNYKCPFYTFDKGDFIKCENQKMTFSDSWSKKDYSKTYCCNNNNWKECSNAKLLLKIYGDYKEEKKNENKKKKYHKTQTITITKKEDC